MVCVNVTTVKITTDCLLHKKLMKCACYVTTVKFTTVKFTTTIDFWCTWNHEHRNIRQFFMVTELQTNEYYRGMQRQSFFS